MERAAISDCAFKEQCATYLDRLFERAMKGAHGLGCRQQSDLYRNQHCKAFRCKCLSVLLGDMLRSQAPPAP